MKINNIGMTVCCSKNKKINIYLKIIVSKIVLFFLGRGIITLFKNDTIIKKEIQSWNENFIIQIKTEDTNIDWQIQKRQGKLYRVKEENPNISISFKSVDILFKLVTGRLGVSKAYAEHRFLLKGEIKDAMSFVRVIDRTEGYLFPSFITKRILKEVPKREKPMLEIYGRLLLNM